MIHRYISPEEKTRLLKVCAGMRQWLEGVEETLSRDELQQAWEMLQIEQQSPPGAFTDFIEVIDELEQKFLDDKARQTDPLRSN